MLASMYSAVSGLSVHQTKMNTIGNNVSNVNTYGFKSSRVTFSDVFYQSYSGASSPTTTTGGTNASQLGYGSSVGTIDKLLTRGGSASTDRSLDVYINGDGFLPVQDSSGNTLYTRLGNLYFDVNGNLVDGNGSKVLGLTWDENGVVQLGDDGTTTTSSLQAITVDPAILKELTSISIGTGGQITAIQEGAPQVSLSSGTSWIKETKIADTSNYSGTLKIKSAVPSGAALRDAADGVTITGLDTKSAVIGKTSSDATFAVTTEATLQGKLTNVGTYTFSFDGTKWIATDNTTGNVVDNNITDLTTYGIATTGAPKNGDEFNVEVYDKVNMLGNVTFKGDLTASGTTLKYEYADANGTIKTATVTAKSYTNDGTKEKYEFDIPVSNTDGVTTTKTITVTVPTAMADSNNHQLGTVTPATVAITTEVYEKSGQSKTLTGTWNATTKTGDVTFGDITLTLDSNKFATMNMSNLTNKQIGNVGAGDGTVVTIGQLALATFTNQDGLVQEGSGYYTISSNSGAATISVPGNNGTGTTVASSLEMSNVDLASEFTEMIFAERGFQANSRVITTSDTLLEELVNLVR